MTPDQPASRHDRPLIAPETLAAGLDDPDLRIVDTRWVLGRPGAGRLAYDAEHLPGAIFLDLDGDLALPPGPGRPGRHPLPDAVEFATRLGAAGIGSDDRVVAYDDVGGWVAARLWWMLDVLGHRRVAVLDGGLQGWLEAGLPVSSAVPHFPPARMQLDTAWTRVIDRERLKARLGSVVLLDARGAARYRGEIEPIDAYPGHIPTARSAPTDGNLVAPNGRFLPPDALARRFRELGADGSQVVTSCGSGVSACHHALAMRLAGLPDPILYEGSYSEWSAAGEPVGVGPEPGHWPWAGGGTESPARGGERPAGGDDEAETGGSR
jgi:thiosulfate/3-mercaptopyruvate sulfurtransferase